MCYDSLSSVAVFPQWLAGLGGPLAGAMEWMGGPAVTKTVWKRFPVMILSFSRLQEAERCPVIVGKVD